MNRILLSLAFFTSLIFPTMDGDAASVLILVNAPASTLACSYTPVTTGTQGTAYTGATPSASGGTGSKTFSETGTLPTGLSISSSTGIISGTPSVSGTFPTIQVKVTDSVSNVANCGASFTLTISPPPTTTWNPSDIDTSQLGLSGGNLTMTMTGAGDGTYHSGRGIANHTSGSYYAEYTVVGGASIAPIGIGSAAFTLNAGNPTASPNAVALVSNGGGIFFNGGCDSGDTFTTGNVVQVAVTISGGSGKFWAKVGSGNWNANASDNPATNTGGCAFTMSGAIYPLGTSTTTGQGFTANFGASAYAFTPPSGFGNW